MREIINSISETIKTVKDLQDVTLQISESYMNLLLVLIEKGILTKSETTKILEDMQTKKDGLK